MSGLGALFLREMRLATRVGGGAMMGVAFFLSLVVVTPLALGPDLNLLARIGSAILWIAALLATLLGLDRLFQAETEDGSLTLLTMSALPLEAIVLVKCAAHWVSTGLPLVVAAPLLGLLLAMDPVSLGALALTLLAGTPALTLVGAIGAALTAGLRRGGLLLPVLVLPMTVPILIFGVAAASGATGEPGAFRQPFLILCALTLLALAGAPFAAAAGLRRLDG